MSGLYRSGRPDGLYERDILAWSQHQADLLRRPGRGQRANDVDWTHVADEIEAVGRCELHAVESFLTSIAVRVLKLHAWSDCKTCGHRREEIVGFQIDANRRFTPSTRQRLKVEPLESDALRQVRAGAAGMRFPADNPFTLDDLLTGDGDVLLNRLPPPA